MRAPGRYLYLYVYMYMCIGITLWGCLIMKDCIGFLEGMLKSLKMGGSGKDKKVLGTSGLEKS